jgi:hypothetical protein
LNAVEFKEKIRRIASEINKAPFVFEVYGLGFPFYGDVDIRKKIYLTLKELEISRINISDFMIRILPDIDILLIYYSPKGPWSLTDNMESKFMEAFLGQVSLYRPRWIKIFETISKEYQVTPGVRIGSGYLNPVEEFLKEDRLIVDIVPIPAHIWSNLPVLVTPDDLRRFSFIRNRLFTTEPLPKIETNLSLDVSLEFRHNYTLNLLKSAPLTTDELLTKIVEINPRRDLIEIYPQTRQLVTAKFIEAIDLALKEARIFIDTNGKLSLTAGGLAFLNSILTIREKIIKDKFPYLELTDILFGTKGQSSEAP